MPRFGLRYSRVALLAAAAMVASVLAIGVAPAGADPDKPDVDHPATYSACVGAATESAGFEDVAGTGYEPAVDCLAHYGITLGTIDGDFNPSEVVQRWQMALFMTRAAGPAGISLGAATSQGFTDIADLSDEARDAVNQFVGSGIGSGRSATQFDPNAPVTRADMAVFLDNFLKRAKEGTGGRAGNRINTIVPDDDQSGFTDLGSVSVATVGAVHRLYELGVTAGTSATTFSPSDGVLRGQMARFITRALAHTIARPKGISAQLSAASAGRGDDDPNLLVSVRDDSFMPTSGARLNMMYASSENLDKLFNEDGSCDPAQFDSFGSTSVPTPCTIGSGYLTDPTGDYVFQDVVPTADVKDFTLWAWTANFGTSYDREDHADVTATATFSVTEDADAYSLSTDLPSGVALAKFGTEVTTTIQLLDMEDDMPVSPVAIAGKKFSITQASTRADGTLGSSTSMMETDDMGRIVLTHALADPDPDNDNNDGTVTITVNRLLNDVSVVPMDATTDMPLVGPLDGMNMPLVDDMNMATNSVVISWSDDEPVPTTLTQKLSARYAVIPVMRGDTATYSVTATLTDQYGQGMPSQIITFESKACTTSDSPRVCWGVGDRGAAMTPARAERQRYTNSNGEAVITSTLTFDGLGTAADISGLDKLADAHSVEFVQEMPAITLEAGATSADGTMNPASSLHWSKVCLTEGGTNMGSCESMSGDPDDVVLIDADNDKLVISRGTEYLLVSYDANDYFQVDDKAVSIGDFEAQVAMHDDIDPPTETSNAGNINISGYGPPNTIVTFDFKKTG